jgi:hypothetical protein
MINQRPGRMAPGSGPRGDRRARPANEWGRQYDPQQGPAMIVIEVSTSSLRSSTKRTLARLEERYGGERYQYG